MNYEFKNLLDKRLKCYSECQEKGQYRRFDDDEPIYLFSCLSNSHFYNVYSETLNVVYFPKEI